jgi:tRNA (guanine37-N1)-methyltransferase
VRIDVATLFPGQFGEVLASSILGRARAKGIVDVALYDIRDFSSDRHRTVDDRPYGGGPGMLLRPEPVVTCVETLLAERGPGHVVLLTPGGRTFTQAVAREYAAMDHLVLVCGRYEGFDARVRQALRPDELSVGPYVLSGGEIAAMAVLDAVVRLLPGALGDAASAALESYADGDDLEAPQWTRPPVWRGLAVPEALVSGDHARIARWRSEEARRRTETRRTADDVSRRGPT